MSEMDKPTAEGQIESIFERTGLGLALILCEEVSGKIIKGGVIASERGESTFLGPDFLDKTEGKTVICVTVPLGPATGYFFPGDVIKFYSP